MDTNKTPWVNASDIGKAEFCPYSLYLSKKGIKPSRQTQSKMIEGLKSHQQWDHERVSGKRIWLRVAVAIALIAVAILVFNN